ncbi:YhgE/Pip family protein [Aestuariimicrobium soli]|uniref:YhgE/Pip domain-containing protein n=1 Tax=Aestuariimicrobium soli TaxID=2035834 RepID=UPI003EBC1C37
MTNRSALASQQWWKIAAAALVPLLVAAAFLAGSWHSGSRTGNVHAAIVNNDQAVTLDGQIVPLGRQLAAAMADRKGDNVTWTLTDTAGAEKGLASGEFAAVVTIPKNFSAAATGFSKNGDSGEQATIDVRTSPSAGVTDAAVAQQIAGIAADTLNKQLTSTYLDKVYVGFNQMGTQFVTLAEGAEQLHTGASSLAGGTKQASDGVVKLDQGVQQLNTGAQQLAAGVAPLKQGGAQVVQGGGQLTTGGSQLAAGGPQLATGASDLATGASQLSAGVAKLDEGAQSLATGVQQYTDGTGKLVDGVSQLSGGLTQLQQGLAAGGSSDLTAQLTPLKTGADELATGAQQLSQGVQAYQGALGGLKEQPAPVPATIPGSDQVLAQCQAQGGTAESCAPVVAAYEQGFAAGMTGGWQAGLTAAEQGLTGGGDPSQSLVAGAAGVAQGAGELSSGVDQLTTQLPAELAAQQSELTTAVDQLAGGAQRMAAQGSQLKTGGTELAGGASQLASGTKQTASGAAQLSSGAGQLATGVKQYTDGVSQYTGGVGQYVTGVNTYVAGVDQFADGTGQVAGGIDQLADNTPELASGMTKLSAGATQLDDGLKKFSDGLAQGQSKVPSYSEQQRENLSTVATRPVQNPADEPVGAAVVPLTIAVTAIGLWLGALVLNWVRAAVPTGVLGSTRSNASLLARTLAPGLAFVAVEALVLGVVGASVMKLSFGGGLRWTALVALVALAFVLVNHALAAWLGTLGRVLSIVAVTAAAAVSVTAAVPGVFTWVHQVTPLAPALTGLRNVVAGESPVGSVGALIARSLVALVLGYLAVARKRSLSVKEYLGLHPAAA